MRRSARFTGAAVAMAAALLVSGCGSSGDDSSDEKKPSEEQSNGADNDSGDDGDGDDPTEAKPGSLTGIWSTKVDGKDLMLTVVGDGAALVYGTDKPCTGRVTDAGKPTITLKCPEGGEERTNGSVDSVDSQALKVTWNGGDTDTFARQADAPSGLPTGLEDILPQG